jgi:antitoxin (DNA-binding transcriptional repressor) of toxin-antitoxin stability system
MAGEEVVIARSNRPLLKLVPYHDGRRTLKAGFARDQILNIAPDFGETPDDFAEYR